MIRLKEYISDHLDLPNILPFIALCSYPVLEILLFLLIFFTSMIIPCKKRFFVKMVAGIHFAKTDIYCRFQGLCALEI